MLKKYIRMTIIGIFKTILPITALFLLTPYILNSTHKLTNIQGFLRNWDTFFLVIHGLFYCLLYFAWPTLVKRLCKNKTIEVNGIEYKQAVDARWYLLSAFILFELLMLWR